MLTGCYRIAEQIDMKPCEQLYIPGKFSEFCEFFKLDPAVWTTKRKKKLPGMARALLAHQLFCSFCMLNMETVQGGGWNADAPGLGKVCLRPRHLSASP